MRVCQNPLVPALDAGSQKSKPYQSDGYMTGFNAFPRQAREQDSFDTPPSILLVIHLMDVGGRETKPSSFPRKVPFCYPLHPFCTERRPLGGEKEKMLTF